MRSPLRDRAPTEDLRRDVDGGQHPALAHRNPPTVLASLLVTGRPNGRDGTVTTDRLAAALDALAILGKPMSKQDESTGPLLQHLTTPGLLARRAARYAPTWGKGAEVYHAIAKAWAHLTKQQRSALREGYYRVLAERVAASAPPVALAPPPVEEGKGSPVEGGCLFCVVPAVALEAQRVVAWGGVEQARTDAWTATSADATVLGGRSSGRLRGQLFHDCADSIEAVGAVGAGAIEHTCERHMRATGRGDVLSSLGPDECLPGLRASAGTTRTENREPWQRIGAKIRA